MAPPSYILPSIQSKILFVLSFLILASAAYAFSRGLLVFAALCVTIFITSFLYWHKPEYSWRRNLDFFVVKCGAAFQLYMALYSPAVLYYYSIMLCCGFFYGASHVFAAQQRHWYSTCSHCMLHILGNAGNFLLYSSL